MSSPVTDFTQDERLLAVSTPLGKDTFLLSSISGSEGISVPFHFELELLAPLDKHIDLDKLLGQAVTVSIATADGDPRYINGIVASVSQGYVDDVFAHYRAQVVPKLALLRHRVDIRIFQNKSVTDIVEQVLKDAGVTGYKLQTSASYQPLDYCVQYNESDFVFVSRLMEEQGIFYFFQHDESNHTLVLADHKSAHQPCPDLETARYERTTGGATDDDVVRSWEIRHEVRAGKYTIADYNFTTPSAGLTVSEPTTVHAGGNDTYELYGYPGDYGKRGDGTTLARLRMQEEEVHAVIATGTSTCRRFVSGYRFTLTDHYAPAANADWVLAEVSLNAHAGMYAADSTNGDGAHYSNRFTCIPFATPYRPERVTPRPVVHGLQPAVVVGDSGEEIWVDKYGRVKVQFFWDRKGQKNAQSSCWVRVAQPWAGKNWGFVQWPRIGQEVLVAFEEGNPDRPVIVGSTYNAEQMPPYTLPDNQTQSGIKTHSSKGGGSDNYNELRFEDKKGSELLFVQAEKDLSTVVKNNETREVKNTRTTTIQSDDTKTITKGKDQTTLDEGDHEITLKKGDQYVDLMDGNRSVWLAKGDMQMQLDDGNYAADLTNGKYATHLTNGDHSLEIDVGDMKIAIHTGDQSTVADAGGISFEALQQIELKVGSSSIKIDQMGVTIKGMMISIEGEIQTQVKGLMTQINGDAMLQAKGAITMIN